MTKTIEQEALDLINEVFSEREYPGDSYINRTSNSYHEALCRALEAHANTRQDMSDAVEHYLDQWRNQTPSREVFACKFGSFIIAKPDPLVEALKTALPYPILAEDVEKVRTALAARGLEIREKRDAG